MAKRKTEKDYHKLAKSRGFYWVGGILPKTVTAKTFWICKKCGYRREARYSDLYSYRGCPYCSNHIKKIKKDYYILAKRAKISWLAGELPKSTHIKTIWKCNKCKYLWEISYHSIQQGQRCPKCVGKLRKVEQDYYNIVAGRAIIWIGVGLPKNIQVKTEWQCKKCGYCWRASYESIRHVRGCPKCVGKLKKVEQDYCDVVVGRDLTWIGKELPKNIMTKTSWKCKKCNYQWEARYNNIQQGQGCPRCGGELRKTEKDYCILGASLNLVWVGDVLPEKVNIKTIWKCKKCNYYWKAHYSQLQQRQGCPKCKNYINGTFVSKPQIKLNKLLCGGLNYPEEKYRIDIAIIRNSQKIAVEYDAQYWHQGREEHDKKRDKFLISRGWKVLHIKSGILLPTRKQLKKAINKLLNGENLVNIYLEDWKMAQ